MIPPTDGASSQSFETTPWSVLFALREGREPTESDREFMQLLVIYSSRVDEELENLREILRGGCSRDR